MATWTDPTDGRVYPLATVLCAICGIASIEVFADAANRDHICDACDDNLFSLRDAEDAIDDAAMAAF